MKEVVYAISNRIYDTFGVDYDIHIEDSEQDFKTPAFFIKILPSSIGNDIMGVEDYQLSFDIIYYPKMDHCKQELINMSDDLIKAFTDDLVVDESLATMQKVPVLNKKWRIVDDILHFTFDVHYYADTYHDDSTIMESLETKLIK